MNMHKSYRVQELAEKLYAELRAQGIEVLMDDRKERPGVMFADMELIGIPHTVVIGDRNLDSDEIEYKYRRSGEKQMIKTGDILDYWSKPSRAKQKPRSGGVFNGSTSAYLLLQSLPATNFASLSATSVFTISPLSGLGSSVK